MDVEYDPDQGVLKLSMRNYIETTMERFKAFDLSQGYPYRELVGCLLWVTLNVMGPEFLRVKDLARLSNSFGETEYDMAMKVLQRIFARRSHGIVIFRHAAGREVIPASTWPSSSSSGENLTTTDLAGNLGTSDDLGSCIPDSANELSRHSLCQGKALFSGVNISYVVEDSEELDVQRVLFPVNLRYRLLAYGDASFAVGESKQSVTGYIIYLNGVPLLWGRLSKQLWWIPLARPNLWVLV
jgi:hypothetical protein